MKIAVAEVKTVTVMREEPQAQAVIITGWEEFEFAVHPSPDRPAAWNVSEATTGLYVIHWAHSAAEAIAGAESSLNSVGKDKVRAAIAAAGGGK